MRKVLILVALAGLLASCATMPGDNSLLVSVGDTKAQVMEAMGDPLDRQMKGKAEAWTYGSFASVGVGKYTVIWIDSGVVSGVSTYRNRSTLGYSEGVKTIDWNEAPDTVVEIRNR